MWCLLLLGPVASPATAVSGAAASSCELAPPRSPKQHSREQAKQKSPPSRPSLPFMSRFPVQMVSPRSFQASVSPNTSVSSEKSGMDRISAFGWSKYPPAANKQPESLDETSGAVPVFRNELYPLEPEFHGYWTRESQTKICSILGHGLNIRTAITWLSAPLSVHPFFKALSSICGPGVRARGQQ